jgi:phosphatidylinositol-3-phosphatase
VSPARLLAALAAAVAAIAVSACGGSSVAHPAGPVQTTPPPIAQLSGGPPAHVAVILMENEEFADIIGSPDAPYINSLARAYALERSMYAITHPSLPNYLALTGGSTFGIDSDCTDCVVHATSIVDQLDSARLSWKAYMQDLPHPCFTGAGAGDYAKKHDPFAYYTRIVHDPARCARIVPLSQLAVDERTRSLPRYIWITPNLCNDMHDCDVQTGDRFLAKLVPPLLSTLGPRGLLFITWDEGSSNDGCCRLAFGGHVVTIAAGGLARRRTRLGVPADHYSLLQTVDDLFGLRRLRGAGCACTPSLAPLLATGAPR